MSIKNVDVKVVFVKHRFLFMIKEDNQSFLSFFSHIKEEQKIYYES